MVIFTIIPLARCNPISANWDMFDPEYTKPYTCIADTVTWPVASAVSAATDLAAVIIPLVILSGLRKPMKQKIGLYSVFAVGFVYVFPSHRALDQFAYFNVQSCWSLNSKDSSCLSTSSRQRRFHLYVHFPCSPWSLV